MSGRLDLSPMGSEIVLWLRGSVGISYHAVPYCMAAPVLMEGRRSHTVKREYRLCLNCCAYMHTCVSAIYADTHVYIDTTILSLLLFGYP